MIGSALVRALNDLKETRLILVDALGKDERWKNLVGKSFLEIIHPGALFDFLSQTKEKIEAIFHLGACSDTTENDVDFLLENNTRYTIRLAEWALERGVRFVYASSAATYGDGSLGFFDDEEALETLRPLNPYGYSKHLVDLWMKKQNVFDRVVGLKYFNVFGPNEYHKGKMASMILKMTDKVQKEGAISLYKSNTPRFGHGEQQRDFIYVKDAVRMTLAFLGTSNGGIFNIGQGQPSSWNQVGRALFCALEKKEKIEYIDMPEELSRQYQNYTCADMTKWSRIMGPGASFSIENAVREYVQEYLTQGRRW